MRKLFILSAVVLSLAFGALAAAAQKAEFNAYRSVSIGMTRDETRDKLGKTKDEFPEEDSFEISDNENVRVFYNGDKKVKAMVITFSGKLDGVPAADAVLGEKVEQNADGGMFKMVRFPDKGFWISYLKTTGDQPTVIITLQEMPKLNG